MLGINKTTRFRHFFFLEKRKNISLVKLSLHFFFFPKRKPVLKEKLFLLVKLFFLKKGL
jgi:hypothetical protein